MTYWQPIETAPKDGTEVLLGRFAEGCRRHGRIRVDRWSLPEHGRGWIGFGQFNPESWPATHWMPLPKPPDAALEAVESMLIKQGMLDAAVLAEERSDYSVSEVARIIRERAQELDPK